jgi:hypothetical protein
MTKIEVITDRAWNYLNGFLDHLRLKAQEYSTRKAELEGRTILGEIDVKGTLHHAVQDALHSYGGIDFIEQRAWQRGEELKPAAAGEQKRERVIRELNEACEADPLLILEIRKQWEVMKTASPKPAAETFESDGKAWRYTGEMRLPKQGEHFFHHATGDVWFARDDYANNSYRIVEEVSPPSQPAAAVEGTGELIKFADADFVVTFTGECPESVVVQGWESVLNYIDGQLGNEADGWSIRNEDIGLQDEDNWTTADFAGDTDKRHIWHKEVGECVYLGIVRLSGRAYATPDAPTPAVPAESGEAIKWIAVNRPASAFGQDDWVVSSATSFATQAEAEAAAEFLEHGRFLVGNQKEHIRRLSEELVRLKEQLTVGEIRAKTKE